TQNRKVRGFFATRVSNEPPNFFWVAHAVFGWHAQSLRWAWSSDSHDIPKPLGVPTRVDPLGFFSLRGCVQHKNEEQENPGADTPGSPGNHRTARPNVLRRLAPTAPTIGPT